MITDFKKHRRISMIKYGLLYLIVIGGAIGSPLPWWGIAIYAVLALILMAYLCHKTTTFYFYWFEVKTDERIYSGISVSADHRLELDLDKFESEHIASIRAVEISEDMYVSLTNREYI